MASFESVRLTLSRRGVGVYWIERYLLISTTRVPITSKGLVLSFPAGLRIEIRLWLTNCHLDTLTNSFHTIKELRNPFSEIFLHDSCLLRGLLMFYASIHSLSMFLVLNDKPIPGTRLMAIVAADARGGVK